jgi:predicted CoA-binding protein
MRWRAGAGKLPTSMPEAPPPLVYPDSLIHNILERVRAITVVGLSANASGPSFGVAKFLAERGYRVIPVNPGLAGQTLFDEIVYARLADIPGPFDMVYIYRISEAAGTTANEAVGLAQKNGISVIWMQLGVRHDEAAKRAEAAGLTVIMDRCPKIKYDRLGLGQS